MRRVGSIPKLGSLPELVTFQCGSCNHVETIAWEPSPSSQPLTGVMKGEHGVPRDP
jgi:hypothetical protein